MKNCHNSLFGPALVQFCDSNSLHLSSQEMLPGDSFTYVSDAWGTQSWLDHVVASSDAHAAIFDMKIDDQPALSDHLPLLLKMDITQLPEVTAVQNGVLSSAKWDQFSPESLKMYSDKCKDFLTRFQRIHQA